MSTENIVVALAENDGHKQIRARASMTLVRAEMNAAFPERSRAIDAILAALVAGVNVLILGPPGTAKSKLVRALVAAFGLRMFDTLCNRFQQPEEVFGPVSVRRLTEDDVIVRNTDGFLPSADVAFLDEVFKGSSALLNALLKAINEGTFRNGGDDVKMPLRCTVAASNELPHDDDNLGAFHDRFVVRLQVGYLKPDSLKEMLRNSAIARAVAGECSAEDLDTLRLFADNVVVTDDALDALIKIVAAVRGKNVEVSDRRIDAAVRVLRAHCAIAGVRRMSSAHLEPLVDILWNRPEDRPHVNEAVRNNVASWIKEMRDIRNAIEDQRLKLSDVLKDSNKRDEALIVMGAVMKALKAMDNQLGSAKEKYPEAADDVAAAAEGLANLRLDLKKAGKVLNL